MFNVKKSPQQNSFNNLFGGAGNNMFANMFGGGAPQTPGCCTWSRPTFDTHATATAGLCMLSWHPSWVVVMNFCSPKFGMVTHWPPHT